VAGCAGCREKLRELRAAKSALADLAPADPQPGWLPHVEELIAGGATPRRTQLALQRLHRGAVATGLAAAALGVGVWLAPPPEAPVSFQDQIRRHLVQMGEPLSDQTSYVVEARYP